MPPSEPRPIQLAGRPYTLLSTLRTRVGARGEHGVVLKHGADAGEVQLIHLQVAQGAGNMQRQYKGHTERRQTNYNVSGSRLLPPFLSAAAQPAQSSSLPSPDTSAGKVASHAQAGARPNRRQLQHRHHRTLMDVPSARP